jgi:hypothetical protein
MDHSPYLLVSGVLGLDVNDSIWNHYNECYLLLGKHKKDPSLSEESLLVNPAGIKRNTLYASLVELGKKLEKLGLT